MTSSTPTIETSLVDLSRTDWTHTLRDITEEAGFFQNLGPRHFAAFVEGSSTLLVTFETMQGMHALSERAQPLGWEMTRDHGWSHLCFVSDGDTWFREQSIYRYMDRLIDDGFFDNFDKVVFYGAGPCGYAAAAYSVAAPGSTVVVIQPQATLDPRVAEWDDRFTDMRRTDFTSRYGYAPDMLDAAEDAFVLYDPFERLDAMHAALYTRSNVTKLRLPRMGDAIQTDLLEMEWLSDLLAAAAEDRLDPESFARLYRARRDYPPYLRNLMASLDRDGRGPLLLALCSNVTARMRAPRFARKLSELKERMAASEEPRRAAEDG